MSTDVDFETRELSKKEQAHELVSHLNTTTVPENMQVLMDNYDDVFRCKHLDTDNAFSVIMSLKTSFLIEEVDRMGRPTDWQLTDRCKDLMQYQEQHGLYFTDRKTDVIHSVGDTVWELPDRDVGPWMARELDLDLEGRKLGLLRDVGIIEVVDCLPGEPNTWIITERFEGKRRALMEYLDE